MMTVEELSCNLDDCTGEELGFACRAFDEERRVGCVHDAHTDEEIQARNLANCDFQTGRRRKAHRIDAPPHHDTGRPQ